MFSGIVESMGELVSSTPSGTNIRLCVKSDFQNELKVDQSVAHNGVCLTVTEIDSNGYYLDVIAESLDKSNLGRLAVGDRINLERSVRLNDRLDGHLVQGHVDQTAKLKHVESMDGSWVFSFEFNGNAKHVLIDKGSICVNGVSLTISKLLENGFEVSIIPYTYDHTNFGKLAVGDFVNIEFDVVGKYIERLTRS